MRVIIITVIITISIFSFAFYSVHLLEESALEMIELLEEVESAVVENEWSLAEQRLTSFQDAWEKNHITWDMLIEHQEIDNIDISIVHINSYIKRQELTECYSEINALYTYLRHIPEIERLNLENLL